MGISYYQFNNLLKNRVPFVLISYEVDFKNFDIGIFQAHLEKHLVRSTPNETLSYLKSQNLPLEQSIVLACPEGKTSEKMAQKLEKAGYKNVYFLSGGYEKILDEKTNAFE